MEEKIVETKVFNQGMVLNLEGGKQVPVNTIVTETYYEGGRKDIHVQITKPLEVVGEQKS